MTEQELQNLVNKDKYQVFAVACRAHVPWAFFRHGWFVVNKKGILSRWEVRHFKNKARPEWGHVFLNNQPPFEGLNIFFYIEEPKWPMELLGLIEGDENSAAERAAHLIEKSNENYPYSHRYEYLGLGINSNTYVQWILDRFPEFNIELPWNFIGKGYKIKE